MHVLRRLEFSGKKYTCAHFSCRIFADKRTSRIFCVLKFVYGYANVADASANENCWRKFIDSFERVGYE